MGGGPWVVGRGTWVTLDLQVDDHYGLVGVAVRPSVVVNSLETAVRLSCQEEYN